MELTADISLVDGELDLSPEIRELLKNMVDLDSLAVNHFLRIVDRGRKGMNVGWANGFERINQYLYGTHRGRYYLIGADSGVGKTTYADFSYLLSAYEYAKANGKKLYCYYYSFELSKTEKIARWVSYYIAVKFGVVLTSSYILGRINGNLPTDEDMKYINAGYAYVVEMFENIAFTEESVHPTKIFMTLRGHYAERGTIKEGAKAPGKDYGPIEGYTPNEGTEGDMVMVFIDHIALTHSEQGLDTKGTIDLLSKYAVVTRNIFGTTWVVLQQFTTDMQTWHRSTKKISDKFIAPQRLDFGDSKYTYRDADVVFGLVAPHQFDLPKYFGYDVERLLGYMIGVHIMKNRYGSASVMIPMFMDPLSGLIEELPRGNTELHLEEYFEKAIKIDELCQRFSPKM